MKINNPEIAEALSHWLLEDDTILSLYEDDTLAIVVSGRNNYDGTAAIEVLRLFAIGDRWEVSKDRHISILGDIEE